MGLLKGSTTLTSSDKSDFSDTIHSDLWAYWNDGGKLWQILEIEQNIRMGLGQID